VPRGDYNLTHVQEEEEKDGSTIQRNGSWSGGQTYFGREIFVLWERTVNKLEKIVGMGHGLGGVTCEGD